MKRSTILTAALACAALILTASISFAQRPHGDHRVTPEQKQASDQAMQTGLSDLQAASSALQSGNSGAAISDIQAAISSMNTAMPIYRGARERSIHAADRAIEILQRNRKNAPERASTALGKAIAEAQAALQSS